MGSSSAVFKALTTCSLGSQFSAGINHKREVAEVVVAPKITPACGSKNQIRAFAKDAHTFKRTYEIECFGRDREEERRDFP